MFHMPYSSKDIIKALFNFIPLALIACILLINGWALGGIRYDTRLITGYMYCAMVWTWILAQIFWPQAFSKEVIWFSAIWVPFLIYVCWNAYALTPVPWLARKECLMYIQGCTLYVIIIQFGARIYARRFLVGICLLIGLISTGCACYQYLVDSDWLPLSARSVGYEGRCTGTLGVPNTFAGLLLLCMFPALTYACVFNLPKALRLLMIGACICFGFGLFLSVSRGALFLVGLVSILGIIVFNSRFKLSNLFTSISIFSVLCLVPFTYIHRENLLTRLGKIRLNQALDDRCILWKAAGKIFLDHPIVGTGLASYELAFEKYRPLNWPYDPIWAHNEYLNCLSDLGIMGAILFFGPMIYSVLSMRKQDYKNVSYKKQNSFKLNLFYDETSFLNIGLALALCACALHVFLEFHFKVPLLFFYICCYLGLIVESTAPVSTPISSSFKVSQTKWFLYSSIVYAMITSGFMLSSARYAHAGNLQSQVERSIKLYNNDRITIENRADFLDQLLKKTRLAYELNPKNADVSGLEANLYYLQSLQNPNSEADKLGSSMVAASKAAIDACPERWQFWAYYGLGLWLQGNLSESQVYFQTALSTAPNNPLAWSYFEAFLKSQGVVYVRK